MRTVTKEIQVYTLEEVRDKAIEKNSYINVDYDWWDSVYYDAAEVGIKITGFDLGRSWDITGKFTEYAETVARLILENHGEQCRTARIAQAFLDASTKLQAWLDKVDGSRFELMNRNAVYDAYRNKEDELEELKEDLLKDILQEYLSILNREYEYLTSEEAIYETLKANDYEFNEDGTIY